MFSNEYATEKQDNNGRKYIEVDWKKYYEYRKGMSWLWYEYGINVNWNAYIYVWNFDKGNRNKQWTVTYASWAKYVGHRENNNRNGQWTFTWAGWNTLTWTWKNGFISEGKIKLKSDGTEIDVTRDLDEGLWEVTKEWKYKDKYIDDTTWEFVDHSSATS